MKTTIDSPDIATAIELLKSIPTEDQKWIVDKLRAIVVEYETEHQWEELLKKHPKPMLNMAKEALEAHKTKSTEPMKF